MVRGTMNNRGYRGAARGSSMATFYTGRGGDVYRGGGGGGGGEVGYIPMLPMTFGRGRRRSNNGYYYKTGRFGILRGPGDFYQTAFPGRLRRRTNVAIDRRRFVSTGGFYGAPQYDFDEGGYEFGPYVPQQAYRRARRNRRGGGAFVNQQRRGRGGRGRGGSGRGAGRRGGRGGRPVPTEADLDAQLDAYMGDDATKSRLDSQLDAYFGRAGGTTSNGTTQEKPEPMSDPNDVNMATAPLVGRELVV